MIITKKNSLNSWLEVAGGKTSYVGLHSYQPLDKEYNEVAKEAFSYTMQYVPLYLLIDRNWHIVTGDELTTASGDIESYSNPELKKICKNQ